MVSAFVDRSAHGSELSEERREGKFKEDSNCSLANTVKKDAGQSRHKRFRIVVSMLREEFGEVENISLQLPPTHLQVADPLTKMMERDILVSFFNSRAFQLVATKIYARRTVTENV